VVVVILSSVDESVSVNSDGDCGGETGRFGFGFRRRVFGKVSNSVMVPESRSRLLVLRVRSGVRVEGCRDRVGSLSVKKLSVSKKKWKEARLGNQH
jgi:hypothetical protein